MDGVFPPGGPFATKNKASIDNNRDFSNFIKIISAPGEEQFKCVFTLIEKDPKAVAQVSFYILSSLLSMCKTD